MKPHPRLGFFILNILDHCNLGCVGCDHFAAIARERFVSLEDIKRDLERISALFNGEIKCIGVMGGEPLLHPQLKEILTETRRYLPKTRIELGTNGIVLLKQDEAFWTVCRENNIVIVITKYPIKLDFRKITETAQAHKVTCVYRGNTGETIKTSNKIPLDVSGRQDPTKSFMNCLHANKCVLLMEGKIYTCTVAPNIHIFNDRFNTTLALENEDYLDIHHAASKEEVLEFLCKPKPFCRYCHVSKRSFGHPWQRSKQEMSEWVE